MITLGESWYQPSAYKFDCQFSRFDENETLFFGGDTVLRVLNLRLCMREWVSLKKYLNPLDVFWRLVEGKSITDGRIGSKAGKPGMAKKMRQFCEFLCLQDAKGMPDYVKDTLKFSLRKTKTINLQFCELFEYEWANPRFVHTGSIGDKMKVNVLSICKMFHEAEEISFTMPEMQTLSEHEWESLIEPINHLKIEHGVFAISFV